MATSRYLPVGCYGKVPAWREYLEVNCAYPSSRAFRNWVREGRAAAASKSALDNHGSKFAETRRRRFLFAPPGSADVLIGAIGPSRDQAGRRNSFAVFSPLPRRFYGRQFALLPAGMPAVWDAIDESWTDLCEVATRSGLEELVDATRVPAPAPAAVARASFEALREADAGRLFRRTEGATFEALVQHLPEALAVLKKTGGDGVRIELPLSEDPGDACLETAAWIELLNHQFVWRRFEPSVFVESTPDPTDRRAVLVFGSVTPQDYLTIMGPGSPGDGVLRPADPGGEATETDPPELKFGELLSRRFGKG